MKAHLPAWIQHAANPFERIQDSVLYRREKLTTSNIENMKGLILLLTSIPSLEKRGRCPLQLMVWLLCLGVLPGSLLAEGSKDFVNYPGYRMFLDTRDAQQLKVFANEGDVINFGSSHVGILGGFIKIYRPDGTLEATYDNTGTSTGLGIIYNNVQELAGPTGGGTSMGPGYIPGTVSVGAGQAGIWTLVFDYPSYVNAGYPNILNNAPWTRAADQPNSRRVVLAWDVTVTSSGAGNMGGKPHEGRLYTNEHISLINGNGFNTSPIFYVLTVDGYLYQVNILDADPFRFPISSNSRGLVDGNKNAIYKSKAKTQYRRSADPSSWSTDPDSIYLYEPQAEDVGNLVNNKIFFNLPDTTMPTQANVTDIFRANPHQTWLNNQLQVLVLIDFQFTAAVTDGTPCEPGFMEFGQGGYFIFNTNIGGVATIELDINNNGVYDDPVDVVVSGEISAGIDSLFWDGSDGLGVPLPSGTTLSIPYRGDIRFGELHIALTDVENSSGGVTFDWLNVQPGFPDSLFYYDHSDIGGPVSGGGTPNNALPTSIPFTYGGNFGNDKYIDQWFFIEQPISPDTLSVTIVNDCPCSYASPKLKVVEGGGAFCEGGTLTMSATNDTTGIGDLTYSWTGPNGFSFSETIAENDTSTVTIAPLTLAAAGDYQVVVTTASSCGDTLLLPVTINVQPVVSAITGGGNFCTGDDVTLTAMNTAAGVVSVTYTWTGPNNFTATGTATGTDPFSVTIPGITAAQSGTYTLSLVSDLGCSSNDATVDVIVQPTPVLEVVSGGGAFCEDAGATFSAINTDSTVVSMTCTWTGPNGFFSQEVLNGSDTIILVLTNVNISMAGDYILVCDNNGCASPPLTFNLQVNATPEINGTSPNGDFCTGSDIILTAMNVVAGTGPITYTWTGPNGYFFSALAADPLGTFDAPLFNIDSTNAGTYTLVLETAAGCQSVPQSVTIGILPTPLICNVSGSGDACVGQTVVLSAENCTPGIGPIIYTWTGPNGIAGAGVGMGSGPFEAVIDDIQLADSGTYCLTLQSSDFGCVSQQVCLDVNVFMGLNIIEITPDSTYCEGTDVTLSATNSVATGDIIYTWTGPNGFSFTDTVPSIDPLAVVLPSVTVSDSGQYILTLTSTAGCTAEPDTVLVDVVPGVDNVTITGGGNYCEGSPVDLVATAESTATVLIFTWTNEAGDTILTETLPPPGPSILSFPTATAGVYTVTVTTPDGCDASASALVGITLLPNIIDINNDTTLCELDGLLLCGQNGNPALTTFDYTWVTPTTVIPGVGNGTAVFCDLIEPLATFGAGLYTLVLSNEGCTDVDSFYLTLNPNPVISSIAGGGTYCEGDSIVLTVWNTNPAVDTVIVTCQLPDGTIVVDTVGGLDTVSLVLTGGGTVCCSMESLFGCQSDQVCTEVVIEPNTQPSVPDSIQLCQGETLVLDGTNTVAGTGTVDYTWTGPGGFFFTGTAPWGGPFPAPVPNPQTGNYCLVLITNTGCVSNEVCTFVTVNPLPEITDGINGGGTYCDNETVTLTATVFIADGSDMSYEWTLNGTPVETGTAASGETLSLVATESGSYCLNLTSAAECVSAPNCTDVTINQSPEILEVTGGGVYCEGESVVLSGTGTPGLGTVTWIWTGPEFFEESGTAPSEGPFTVTITGITPIMSGDYTLTLMLGDCVSNSETVTVEVNPMPLITSSEGGGAFCQGEPTTILFTIDPNGADSVDYTVTGPNTDQSGTVTEVTTLTLEITVDPSTAGTYTMMIVSDAGCEGNPAFVIVSVREIDPATLDASATLLCQGDELQLTTNAQVGQNVTYEWYKDGELIATTSVPVLDIPDPTSGEYTVVAFVDGCSSTSAPVAVTVLDAPVAIDDNFSGDLNVPVNGNIILNDNKGGNAVTIELLTQPDNGTVTVDVDGNMIYTPNNNFVGNDQFDYQICLVDCPDLCSEAAVLINISTDVCGVPNVLTVNGDGFNDILEILCLKGGDFPDNSLHIFNRWGDEIYIAEPYLNDWGGTYGNDKKELPAGTYFYLFRLDKNASEFEAGYIKVVK
jgi:gliding motility-associated-like protein